MTATNGRPAREFNTKLNIEKTIKKSFDVNVKTHVNLDGYVAEADAQATFTALPEYSYGYSQTVTGSDVSDYYLYIQGVAVSESTSVLDLYKDLRRSGAGASRPRPLGARQAAPSGCKARRRLSNRAELTLRPGPTAAQRIAKPANR